MGGAESCYVQTKLPSLGGFEACLRRAVVSSRTCLAKVSIASSHRLHLACLGVFNAPIPGGSECTWSSVSLCICTALLSRCRGYSRSDTYIGEVAVKHLLG